MSTITFSFQGFQLYYASNWETTVRCCWMGCQVFEVQTYVRRHVFQQQVHIKFKRQIRFKCSRPYLVMARRVSRAVGKFSNYLIPSEKFIDSQELYDEICNQLPRLLEISNIHLQVSRAGTITQLIAFIILLDGRNEWTPELYGEMAQLLSSISNIESADVPVALKVNLIVAYIGFNLMIFALANCSSDFEQRGCQRISRAFSWNCQSLARNRSWPSRKTISFFYCSPWSSRHQRIRRRYRNVGDEFTTFSFRSTIDGG